MFCCRWRRLFLLVCLSFGLGCTADNPRESCGGRTRPYSESEGDSHPSLSVLCRRPEARRESITNMNRVFPSLLVQGCCQTARLTLQRCSRRGQQPTMAAAYEPSQTPHDLFTSLPPCESRARADKRAVFCGNTTRNAVELTRRLRGCRENRVRYLIIAPIHTGHPRRVSTQHAQ